MMYLALLLALVIGYVIGLLQHGININDNRTPEVEFDENGKPKYNSSVSSLDEEYLQWIEKNRG